MSLGGKITTISCRIYLRAIEPVSKSLIFRPLYRMVMFYAAQRFNQFNFGRYKKWVIDVDKCSCTLYSSCYVCYYQRRNKASQSLNSVWQWMLTIKRVSLHNSNIRTLLAFKFYRRDIHDIFIIPAKFYIIRCWLQTGHGILKVERMIKGLGDETESASQAVTSVFNYLLKSKTLAPYFRNVSINKLVLCP